MNAVDTNILLYARDLREPIKQQIASDLIQSVTDAVLIWQVACEYVAASRKLQAAGYGADRAWSDIMRLSRLWPLRTPTNHVLARAWSINQTKSLSVWDALLVAACLDAEVTTLYTEDLQHGADIENLRIVNPFIQST